MSMIYNLGITLDADAWMSEQKHLRIWSLVMSTNNGAFTVAKYMSLQALFSGKGNAIWE